MEMQAPRSKTKEQDHGATGGLDNLIVSTFNQYYWTKQVKHVFFWNFSPLLDFLEKSSNFTDFQNFETQFLKTILGVQIYGQYKKWSVNHKLSFEHIFSEIWGSRFFYSLEIIF